MERRRSLSQSVLSHARQQVALRDYEGEVLVWDGKSILAADEPGEKAGNRKRRAEAHKR